MLVTSPHMGDGKSTVAANLAALFAACGQRMLVVDADFRRPAMCEVLILDTGPSLLTNEATALIPHIDAVVLAVRSGRLLRSEARTTVEQLSQAGATVAGLALVGAEMPRRLPPAVQRRAPRVGATPPPGPRTS